MCDAVSITRNMYLHLPICQCDAHVYISISSMANGLRRVMICEVPTIGEARIRFSICVLTMLDVRYAIGIEQKYSPKSGHNVTLAVAALAIN